MVVDTEHEKKPKFQKDLDEHGDFLTSQLGLAEAVEQPRREQWVSIEKLSSIGLKQFFKPR